MGVLVLVLAVSLHFFSLSLTTIPRCSPPSGNSARAMPSGGGICRVAARGGVLQMATGRRRVVLMARGQRRRRRRRRLRRLRGVRETGRRAGGDIARRLSAAAAAADPLIRRNRQLHLNRLAAARRYLYGGA